MCGIAGAVRLNGQPDPPSVIRGMTAAIRHRGPDDERFFEDPFVSLGHRRLSIIDLASGHQPMANEDHSLWIVYNGEIFNHASLRPALEAAGHQYRTYCDTETILHSYEQHGPQCVTHLRGMFAFAIWDQARRVLFCARDRLGIKPFYYYWDGRLFAFASEIKALLEHPAISAHFNQSLLPETLTFGYSSGEETLFSGIRKLMPGHWLRLDLNQPEPQPAIRQYWDVPAPDRDASSRPDSEWIAETRRRLEETVEMRLMSDVPLGMFLSGGVDSSVIAAIASRLVSHKLQTFAVGYSETRYSELGWADQVAKHIGTDHRVVTVSMEDFFEALPRLTWHEDEPISWPSSVSLYFVSQLAADHVKVVLTGEGSDELFGGYERYAYYLFNRRWMNRYRVVPSALRAGFRQWLGTTSLLRADLRRKFQHSFLGRQDSFESLQLDNFYCSFPAAGAARLLENRGDFNGASPHQSYLRYWEAASSQPLLQRMLYTDQKTYLVELLMKQDQMSMAASIESRVPFLDHPFVEFAAQMPASLKIRNGQAKYALKKVAEEFLPHDIVYRKKMGFPTPLKDWLLRPQSAPLYDYLLDSDGLLGQYLDRSGLKTLLDRHRAQTEDATDRIWRLLTIQTWGDLFLTGRRPLVEGGLPGFSRELVS